MINSLATDSHIGQSLQRTSGMNKEKSTVNVALHAPISANKSDSISFSGLAGAKLANDDVFAKIIAKLQGGADGNAKMKPKKAAKALKEFTGKAIGSISEEQQRPVNELLWETQRTVKKDKTLSRLGKQEKIASVMNEKLSSVANITKEGFVDSIMGVVKNSPDNINPDTLKVISKNEEDFKKLLSSAFDYVAEESKGAMKPAEAYAGILKAFNVASDSYGAVLKPKFYQSEKLHAFLNLAQKNQALFDAAYAFVLAGAVRPITIIATSDKANLENNKYASAHSIASGLIGLGIATLINTPIAKAVGKVKNNPTQYLSKDLDYIKKGAKGQLEGKNFDIATKYVNMGVKLALAVPQAALTVALVPMILKNVFGMEKGKSKQPAQQVSGGNK